MDTTKIVFLLLVLVACNFAEHKINFTSHKFFPAGHSATLKCTIDPTPQNVENFKITWRKGSIIGFVEGNETQYYTSSSFTNSTFLMSTDELKDTGIVTGTIVDFGIDDEGEYSCEADDTAIVFAANADFTIGAYNKGDVYITDLDIELDIRPVSPSESIAESVDENMMESNETMTTMEPTTTTTTTEDPGDGKTAVVACHANGVYPLPEKFEFMTSQTGNVWNVDQADFSETEQNSDQTYNVSATLRILLNADLDGAVFQCKVLIVTTDTQSITAESQNVSSALVVLHDTTNVFISFNKRSVLVGDEVVIGCRADGNPPATINLLVPNGDQFDVTTGPHNFYAVKNGDAGTYTCEASNSDQMVRASGTLEVEWMDKPDITDGGFNPVTGTIDATEGEDLSYMCAASGTPSISYVWSKDGVQIHDNSVLNLQDVQYSDSGTYSCLAVGGSGEIKKTSSFTLNVRTACVATISEKVVSNSQSSPGNAYVRVKCVATGNPTCQMDLEGYSGGVVQKSNNTAILTIESLPKQVNAIEIMCIASNNLGTSTHNTTLSEEPACCEPVTNAGLGTGVIIIIILLVALVVVGIPVGCYVARKRKEHSSKAADEKNAEEGEGEKLGPNDDNQA